MAIAQEDIVKSGARDNDGGLKIFAFYALLEDILTFPVVPPTPTDLSDSVTITDDFVMKTGKKFWKIESTLETSGLDGSMVGERDGRSAENMLDLQHPGSNKSFIGWLEENKNRNLVLIVEEIGGSFRVIGSPGLPASIEKATFPSGKKVADAKKIEVTIKSIGRIAPYYEGTIPITPAA